ncbi:MAG TPA: hypothetical protein VML92_02515 [Steroidobacteraceae bacterium]|nr:hypothetical protein [Steroidobacteraceae bacterium]
MWDEPSWPTTGEIERRPHEIGGVAVSLASRVLALARPGEVLVSGTWRLFAVTDAD